MNRYLNIVSLLSVIGTLGWIATDFFGGMVIYALMYIWIIVPIMLAHVISFIITISRIFGRGFSSVAFSGWVHIIGLTVIIAFGIYSSELFKPQIVLSATLEDDLNTVTIDLRENNEFNTTVNSMFGFVERISGEYHISNDTIIFHKSPYSNDFIPEKIIIDKADTALYFQRLEDGRFNRSKYFGKYFKIELNRL